jgi:hypothetical protein
VPVISPYFYPLFVLIQVIFLLLVSSKMPHGFKLVFGILSAYWFLSYVLRPIFYLYSNSRGISSKIYDQRIANTEDSFSRIMILILIGNSIFCLFVYGASRISQRNRNRVSRSSKFEDPKEVIRIIRYGLSIGFISLLVEQTQYQNVFSKSLFPLFLTSFCAYIWKRDQLKIEKRNDYFLIVGGFLTTAGVSFLDNNSKGVIITPVVLIIFRHLEKRFHNQKLRYTGSMSLMVIGSIPVFNFLQERKLGQTSIQAANQYSENLPWFMSPFLTILQRFDQFSRVTDAYFSVDHPLGSYANWLKLVVSNLEWNPLSGRTASSFGQIWNQIVTNQSIAGARFSKVSLAQGPIAEGYVWNGIFSMVLECIIVVLIFIIVSRALDGRILSVLFGLGVIGNGRIFENGTIGIAATTTSTLKFVLFIYVISKVIPVPKRKVYDLRYPDTKIWDSE